MSVGVRRVIAAVLAATSGVAALALAGALTIDAFRAAERYPEERARLANLQEENQASATVAATLHTEFDVQTATSLERDQRVATLSWWLLAAAVVFLLSGKWLVDLRRPRMCVPRAVLQRHQAWMQFTDEPAPPTSLSLPVLDAPTADLAPVDDILARTGAARDAAIAILHELQAHYRYLPDAALRRICERTEITPSQIVGVASFYERFRRTPVGEHEVHVCHGTACHVAGATRITDELRRRLGIPADADTDPHGRFTVQSVPCLGCCTLAPVVQVDGITHGHLQPDDVPRLIEEALTPTQANNGGANTEINGPLAGEIRIGLGSCCVANGSASVAAALHDVLAELQTPVSIKPVGCVGMCHNTPLLELVPAGGDTHRYTRVQPEHVRPIVRRHFKANGIFRRIRHEFGAVVDKLRHTDAHRAIAQRNIELRDPPVAAFLGPQVHIATEHCGDLDPLDIDEYIAHEGFVALRRCTQELTADAILAEIAASGLRGRGGAGFPTAEKWRRVRTAEGAPKYIVCNGDEGDPGAFMDRMLMESYPYRVIEGLAIAALATGATEGIFYIRAEYPLAVERITTAITRCEERGIIGDRLLDTDQPLRIRVAQGAGAFVCGEETALLASLAGERGMPTLRPPYPAERGFREKPTLVNNVETLTVVPWILRHGGAAFANLGTSASKGTKVFALTGKVRRGGLIEVPMGVTIRQVVEDIGGGIRPEETAAGLHERHLKAVQIGGPSGGCVPAALADTPIDYEDLANVGAMMGSGGLVVLDDADCMVDIARYFLAFTQHQSCGKCTPCRVGTRRMLEILDRIRSGHGQPEDLSELETLGEMIRQTSLCGLGGTAPNPVLTTLRHFRDEYEAHIAGHCPAGRCTDLIAYHVTDACTGCTICAQNCPAGAIELRPYEKHAIDHDKCTRCDVCRVRCPEGAIEIHSSERGLQKQPGGSS